ncbi:MAG: M23 family metallopeptidase, partial [bacterium]|nr:M23 family metallopeptidase [bacterium]
MWTKSTKLRFRGGLLALGTLLVASVVGLSDSTWLYKASILDWPEHEPFDGTVYPVQMVPDWVGLDSSKWDLPYSELDESDLVAIPVYDPTKLSTSTDDLVWGDPDDNILRNAKITYSTPYLGNYELDGIEGAGSHPAVDIKIPEGTPIFAIANGTVIKISNQSSGFGNHIVLQHNNFPDPNGSSATIVLYSSYNHNSANLVSEGDVVKKGQQIALSGSTGTATTPHLHFQIDNDQAPWHPFWPFTWAEVSEAGLNFFSAVNEGLGRESARLTTVNPLNYVQTYLDVKSGVGPEAESYVSEEETVVLEEP